MTTNNKFAEAEVKNGKEVVGDMAEKTAWSQVVKDPEYHIIESDFFSLSNRESNHFNQGMMKRFMLERFF